MVGPELSSGQMKSFAPHSFPAAVDEIAAGHFSLAQQILLDAGLRHSTEGHRLLAVCLAELNDLERAIQILRRLARMDPSHPFVLYDLAVLQFRTGQWASAVQTFRRALQLKPDDLDSAVFLASALRLQGTPVKAQAALARLLERNPRDNRILEGLVLSASEAEDVESILPLLDRALAVRARSPLAFVLAAEIHIKHGRGLLACDYLRRDGRMSPAAIDSIQLYFSLASPAYSVARQKKLVSRWVENYLPAPSQDRPGIRSARSRQPLRVGYLTGEFTRSPAHYFIYPLIRYHDASLVHVFAYHNRSYVDDRTRAVRRLSSEFHHVSEWTDDQVIDRIRRDRIDVLVDLSGHCDDNRLSVFRQRPAPISFCYPNYPSTTGLPEIDYIFTDRWIDPHGSPSKYVEKPWYIDSGYLSFTGIPDAPPLSPLPALKNGYITFGVLQQTLKFHPGVWDCLAGALRETPRSKLILRSSCDDFDNRRSVASRRVLHEFESRGVSASRVELGGSLSRYDYLKCRDQFDIALDTFPFNGQTTTCDNFWMGVPTVSLAGQTHVSRVGYSLLSRLGLEDWVATSTTGYVELIVKHAQDLTRLASLRRSLRATTQKRLNPKVLAKAVERAYLSASGRL